MTNRFENLEYFRRELGLDDAHARILLRAERLQETGQVDSAAVYFKKVLEAYPGCEEARVNLEMLSRIARTCMGPVARLELQIPADARLSVVRVGCLALEEFQFANGFNGWCFQRQEDGRSRFYPWSDLVDHLPELQTFVFPREWSDRLWVSILQALHDGSGLSSRSPQFEVSILQALHNGSGLSSIGMNDMRFDFRLSGVETRCWAEDENHPINQVLQQAVQEKLQQVRR